VIGCAGCDKVHLYILTWITNPQNSIPIFISPSEVQETKISLKATRTPDHLYIHELDDDDKLYLTTLTLSAEAGFHNGRVKNINKLLQVK
jgi:hypothetical protein